MKYIINFNPRMIKEPKYKEKNIESVLERVIYLTFIELSNEGLIDLDIINNPLSFKCDLIRDRVLNKLNDLNLNATPFEVQNILDCDVHGHSILILEDEEEIYLIDPSYSQFFLKENCHEDKYLINQEKQMVLLTPDPGYYYLNNPHHINIARRIMEKGFIKLNQNTAKVYFDSFYKLRRGYSGFLETTGKTTELSGQTYLNSILKLKEKSKKSSFK